MDEFGNTLTNPPANREVWTGTVYNGSSPSYLSPDNAQWCGGWYTDTGSLPPGGWRGRWEETEKQWTGRAGLGNQSCANQGHLCCFEY